MENSKTPFCCMPLEQEDKIVVRTPFGGGGAYAAARSFADEAWINYGVSVSDGRVVLMHEPFRGNIRGIAEEHLGVMKRRLSSGRCPAAAVALVEWLARGVPPGASGLAEAFRARDPLEVEEFEDYLEAVTAHPDPWRSSEMIRERLRADGREEPVWWYSERTRRLVCA